MHSKAGWNAGRDPYHNPHEMAHHYTPDGIGDGGVTRTCDGRGSVVTIPLTSEPVMIDGTPAKGCPKCLRKVVKEYRRTDMDGGYIVEP